MDRSSFNDRTTSRSRDSFERRMEHFIGLELGQIIKGPVSEISSKASLYKYRLSFTAVINTVGHGKLPRVEF